MKRFITTKTGLAALVGAVAVGVTSFGAYAWFTNSGSANSQDSGAQVISNNTSGWQIATDPSNTTYSNSGTALVPTPTDSAAAVVATIPFTITNVDDVSEHLNSFTVSINSTWATSTGCSASWFKIGSASTGSSYTHSSLGVDLAPHADGAGSIYHGAITLELVNADANQDACQGTFPKLDISAA